MRGVMGRRNRWWWLVVMLGVAALALAARPAAAHPLGNFTVNRYARVEPGAAAIRIVYAVDMAEIPTYQEGSDIESSAYLDRTLSELARGLQLTLGGERLPLTVDSGFVTAGEGQGGLKVLRIDAVFTAALPEGARAGVVQAHLRDTNYDSRLGWREIVVRGTSGAAVRERSVPAGDRSNALRAYPEDRLQSPLDVREARFSFAPGIADPDASLEGQEPARAAAPVAPRQRGPLDGFARAAATRQLTPALVLVTLLAAVFWGALHALGPGHGKTIVAAYLVGSRGTARHALFLGLTVTVTHTAGVYVLGLVTLSASRWFVPEDVYPVLSLLSGLLVAAMGLSLLWQRLKERVSPSARQRSAEGAAPGHDHPHDHPHDHSHDHDHDHGRAHRHGLGPAHRHVLPGQDGRPVKWRALLGLGVVGGMIPCPTAIVVLLTSISLGRVGFGLLLVAAFSTGLAAVLTGIGLVLVYARSLVSRVRVGGGLTRAVPVASAAAVVLVGAVLTLNALGAGLPAL